MDNYTMAGDQSKRYYWIRLKDSFFENEDIKVVLAQKNGAEYVIFWQKLLLRAIKKQEIGLLQYKENIPYTPDILATVTDTNIDIVKGAMTLFKKLNMVEVYESGEIWIDSMLDFVGSECTSAERVRRHRAKKKELEGKEKKAIEDKRYNVTKGNRTSGRYNVTFSNEETETETEIEKETDNNAVPACVVSFIKTFNKKIPNRLYKHPALKKCVYYMRKTIDYKTVEYPIPYLKKLLEDSDEVPEIPKKQPSRRGGAKTIEQKREEEKVRKQAKKDAKKAIPKMKEVVEK